MEKDSNDQAGLVNAIQAKPVMNEEFLLFYSTYPEHRRLDILDAERAWYNAALTNKEVIVLLDWLRERQEEDPSWHPRAMGMYVPKLDSFLKKRWWLSPKARMRP